MHLDPAMVERVRRTDPQQTVSSPVSPVPWYREVAPWQRITKRAIDIGLSVAGLSLFLLALPFLAVAIKLDSRGPVFYSQVRVGINRREGDRRRRVGPDPHIDRRRPGNQRDRRRVVAAGHTYYMHKLRTMYVDSESDGVRWASKNDPRITRVGHILRQTRLDELPQFWNVLTGEMSIVGPRPERPPFITHLSAEVPGYLQRLQFKPGITGLAQVENGYDDSVDSVERKVEMDVRYMREFSLLGDFMILARSVAVVLTGRGAF